MLAAGMAMLAGGAIAHDPNSLGPGTPTCIESNLMAADAENGPFSNQPGPGRVVEMNMRQENEINICWVEVLLMQRVQQ